MLRSYLNGNQFKNIKSIKDSFFVCSNSNKKKCLFTTSSITNNNNSNVNEYKVCVGIEIHAQISSNTKLFSDASTSFDLDKPNELVTLFDAAIPGTMPSLNKYCVEQTIKTGLAFNGNINKRSMFERKHYFYPDMPQGYQITQQRLPIVTGGKVKIEVPKTRDNAKRFDIYRKDVGITRIQIEQDSGKSIRDLDPTKIFIDLNRAGSGLMEIVSEPDMRSSDEAAAFVRKVQSVLKHIGTCNGNMEEGNLRCDVNVSIFKDTLSDLNDDDENETNTSVGDGPLSSGERVEIKNLNSIKGVQNAIDYEFKRQVELAEKGTPIEVHETRGYDAVSGKTLRMRRKEAAADYRFMPEPDLLPLHVDDATIDQLKENMPELPDQMRLRLEEEYNLSVYESSVLMEEEGAVNYFENVVNEISSTNDDATPADIGRIVWNWLANDVFGRLKNIGVTLNDASTSMNLLSNDHFVEFITLLIDEKISTKTGKDVLDIIFDDKDNKELKNNSPREIVKMNNWEQLSNVNEIEEICFKIINDEKNSKQLNDYESGKKPKLFGFFVGKVLKESNGKANPKLVNTVLKDIFEKRK